MLQNSIIIVKNIGFQCKIQINDNNKEGTRFLFPFSVYKLKVYDISMVNNVGLGTVLYMNTTDPTIIDRFEEEFKRYGIDEILTGKAEIKGIIVMMKQ